MLCVLVGVTSAARKELLLDGYHSTQLTTFQVNGAVDAMDGERNALQTELDSYQQQLSAALDDLEEEKNKTKELEKKLLVNEPKVGGSHN